MIPAVVMGLIFHDTIKSLFNPVNVMYALIVGGVLLIAAEVLKPKQPRAVGIDDMTYRQAFVIGCFQCWRCGEVSPARGRLSPAAC